MATVYIGIGTNLGNRKVNICKALSMIEDAGLRIIKQSALYETQPWGVTDQPMFFNSAAMLETELGPHELLNTLKGIERRMGRLFKSERWGPRVIDLDILFYDSIIMNEQDLIIPHKYAAHRDFVLIPLMEIAPEMVHPALNMTIAELAKDKNPEGLQKISETPDKA